jgi:hypothetical protein
MKPAKIFGHFIALAAIAAAGTTARAAETERVFEGGLSTLQEVYESLAIRVQDMSYRDVKISCVGVVFLEWQDAYLEVMRRTQLTLSNMALGEYGKFMSNVDADQRGYNTGRWGLVDRTRQELLERRVRVAGTPQGTRGITFTAENVHRDELIRNMVPCLDEDFGKVIDADVAQPDLSRLDTSHLETVDRGRHRARVGPARRRPRPASSLECVHSQQRSLKIQGGLHETP